jgi:hypothetical protein
LHRVVAIIVLIEHNIVVGSIVLLHIERPYDARRSLDLVVDGTPVVVNRSSTRHAGVE